MKRIVIIIAVILTHQVANSAITEAPVISEKVQAYPKDTKVGFEIINEAAHPIWIAVQNGGDIYAENGNNAIQLLSPTSATKEQRRCDEFGRELPPVGTLKRLEIDTNKDTIVMIWTKNPGIVKIKDIFHPEHTALKKPDSMYTFTKGKTMYVRWAFRPGFPYLMGKGELRHQRGGKRTRAGKVGITNLLLANNVGEKDIKKLPIPL